MDSFRESYKCYYEETTIWKENSIMKNKKKLNDHLMFMGGLGIGVFIATWPKIVVKITDSIIKGL